MLTKLSTIELFQQNLEKFSIVFLDLEIFQKILNWKISELFGLRKFSNIAELRNSRINHNLEYF